MIVACWSGPRNISTALMRSWSSRKDTFVVDEPFYAYYLKETQKNHPMKEQIIKYYSSDYEEVVNYLTYKVPNQKKIWYQKHMAHHLIDLSKIDWIKKCQNCINPPPPHLLKGRFVSVRFNVNASEASSVGRAERGGASRVKRYRSLQRA